MLYELAQYASDPKDQENMRKMASSSPEGKVCVTLERDLMHNVLTSIYVIPVEGRHLLNLYLPLTYMTQSRFQMLMTSRSSRVVGVYAHHMTLR